MNLAVGEPSAIPDHGAQKSSTIAIVAATSRQAEQRNCVNAERATMFQNSGKPVYARWLRTEWLSPVHVRQPAFLSFRASVQSSMIACRSDSNAPIFSSAF